MAKQINTRIVQKHDSLKNWKKATGFIPEKGEFFLVDDYECPLVVGDGINSADILSGYPLFQKITDSKIDKLFLITIKGTWRFHDVLILPNKVYLEMFNSKNFQSNGNEYFLFLIQTRSNREIPDLRYGLAYIAYDGETQKWASEEDRIVDFGDGVEMNQSFYEEFFKINANAIAGEVEFK